MRRWLKSDRTKARDTLAFLSVTEGLQKVYQSKLLPVEEEHLFHQFYSPALTNADFAAKPLVLLIGQYSSGKTTFIRHLLGRDYPGLRIGPEPTTDKFVAICHGPQDQVIPGNALVSDKTMPFTQLTEFGNSFLSRFECARLDNPVLQGISLIDTPGVLSGEKQRIKRGYEFETVTKWFADRVDSILLLFDVQKLDISDEFRRVILALKGNDHKMHVILNKADRCTTPQLMRVYGALMWNLGKVLDTPEVSRVYLGSWWDEPLYNDEQRRLFESEENDLYTMLAQLPRSAAVRKLNDFIKRARLAKVHACLIDYFKKKLPTFGKDKEMRRMMTNLPAIYTEIAKERNLALGDFPDPAMLAERLAGMDTRRFHKLDKAKMEALELCLSEEMTTMLRLVPEETSEDVQLTQVTTQASPFAVMKIGGQNESTSAQAEYVKTPPDVEEYREEFVILGPDASGKITGQKAKEVMIKSKLPSKILHQIWTLSDVDKDGKLNVYEFALVRHLIKMKLSGLDLPPSLPEGVLPSELRGSVPAVGSIVSPPTWTAPATAASTLTPPRGVAQEPESATLASVVSATAVSTLTPPRGVAHEPEFAATAGDAAAALGDPAGSPHRTDAGDPRISGGSLRWMTSAEEDRVGGSDPAGSGRRSAAW